MKNFYFLSLLALLYSCNSSKTADPKPTDSVSYAPPKPLLPPEEKAHYAALVSNFVEHTFNRGNFNGSILVAKNGEIVYEAYKGYKNLRLKDTLTPETPFQIASTSKTLTSAAILLLVQQGKLQLNDPVTQFIPSFPYADVTVKTLLNHRSGLPEYLYFFEKNNWDRNAFATNNNVIEAFSNWKPGRASRVNSRFDYCNTNFVLLASIVEKVSGLPFPQYMKQNVFEPLKMNNTFVFTISDTARATPSYEWNGHPWQLDFSDGAYGDKNVYSTVRDLLKWDQALYGGKFIAPQLLDSAFTSYSNERKTMHNYGLGWRILEFPNGKRVVYHNGRWHGFNSTFARLTDEKVTIIMLNNKFNRNLYNIARKMYNLFGNYDAKNAADVD